MRCQQNPLSCLAPKILASHSPFYTAREYTLRLTRIRSFIPNVRATLAVALLIGRNKLRHYISFHALSTGFAEVANRFSIEALPVTLHERALALFELYGYNINTVIN